MTEELLTVKAQFDRNLVVERGRSVRYLAVDVTASDALVESCKRTPLSLALVLDASTSMYGDPMSCARKAARGVIDAMKDNERLSIVSFGADVQVHLAGVKMDSAGRHAAMRALLEVDHRIYTNLSGGWLRGAECLANVMQKESGHHSHVVLLSDGHANRGICDSEALQHHAEQLRMRGLYTSTVGIGNHYSATLLQSLAEYGGGRMHDAEHPEEIVEVVLGELHDLCETVAEDVQLTLTFPSDVMVENISGFPTARDTTSLCTAIGPLPASGTRTVIFRVTTPTGNKGDTLDFTAKVSAKKPGSNQKIKTKAVSASLMFETQAKNLEQPRDQEIGMKVAGAWHASLVRVAVDLNRRGEIRKLKQTLDHELKYLSTYCMHIPQASRLVNELQTLRVNADYNWQERLRKEMQITSYRYLTSTEDHRTASREHWSESLGYPKEDFRTVFLDHGPPSHSEE